jgi:hypothetical protein
MHTLPSIEDVAIYIALEGVFGTTWACGVRGLFVAASDVTDGTLFGACACDAILLIASGAAFGRGGGNGDIEMQEVDAE